MKKLLVFPTWILICILRHSLKMDHPLKQKITLKEWSDSCTELTIFFSVFFWISIINFSLLLIYLIK